MSLLVAGIAAAVSAAASAIGAVASSDAEKRKQRALEHAAEQKQKRLDDWYDRTVNENPMERATAQQSMTKLQELLRNNNKAVAGTQSVMGGTTAAAAAQKEQSNKIVSDTASTITAQADARKDNAESAYLQGSMNIDDQNAQITAQQAAAQSQAIQQAANGVSNSAASFTSAYYMPNGGTASDKARLHQKITTDNQS